MATTRTRRSNEDWLRALRGDGPDAAEAQAELRALVLAGLRKATASFGPLDEGTLEDLTQSAVLRILEKLDRFEGRSRFTTWAWSVAVHSAFGELRKRSPVTAAPPCPDGSPAEDCVEDPREGVTQPAERAEIVAAMHRVIEERLTERQRRAILAELAGRSPAEMQDELGGNRNAIYKLLHDARRKLHAGLDDAGISDDDVRQAFDL